MIKVVQQTVTNHVGVDFLNKFIAGIVKKIEGLKTKECPFSPFIPATNYCSRQAGATSRDPGSSC